MTSRILDTEPAFPAAQIETFFHASIERYDGINVALGMKSERLWSCDNGSYIAYPHAEEKMQMVWKWSRGGGNVAIFRVRGRRVLRGPLWQLGYHYTYPQEPLILDFLWHSLLMSCKQKKFVGVFGEGRRDGGFEQVNHFSGSFGYFIGTAVLYENDGGDRENTTWRDRGIVTYYGGLYT